MKSFVARAGAVVMALSLLSLSPAQAEFITLTRTSTVESKLPTNISTITADDIRQSGATTVADALQVVPGVDVQQSGGLGTFSSVRLRGVPSSASVQVVIDDQPIGGVAIQNINLSLIPTENIERIEIVRGASSMLYGANTTAGVIHIITKKTPGAPSVELNGEGRSFRTRIFRGGVGGTFGKWDLLGTGDGYHTDGYMQNTNADEQATAGTVGYRFDNGGHVELASSFLKLAGGTSDGTPHPFDEWNGHEEREANSQTQKFNNQMWRNRLTLVSPIGTHAQLTTSAFHQHENYLFFNRPAIPFFADSGFVNRILGVDSRMAFDEGTTVGGSYERDDRDAIGQDSHDVVNVSGYAEQEINAGKLTLQPALRFDNNSSFGGQWDPRLLAVLHASDKVKFSASAARSFRAPTIVDLYFVSQDPFFPAFDFFGNPNLKPEKAWSYDLGMRVAPFNGMEAGVSGFYSRIEDRITPVDTDGNGNVDTLKNISKAEVSGVETDLSMVTGPVRQTATYTYQRAIGTSPDVSNPNSTQFVELRLTPRHTVNYRLTVTAPFGLEVTNTIQYVTRQFSLDNQTGPDLPPYGTWNIRVEQPIGPARVYMGADNILSRLYGESLTFGNPVPQPTRVIYAGLNLRFGRAESVTR